ncbi:MAG TPA: disulfide oxidoreductase [Patescibacteria group bacterium]|nr:disulfide oxidoreductase [Patescibacteria group bacterium]
MNFIRKNILYIAFIQALLAAFMSLYFSLVMQLPPCVLCWYQRICMYPIAIILAVGILRKDKKVYQYVLPFSIIGLAISVYHNLLYYQILPESAAPCEQGISCTTRLIEWGGFVTIPLLSLVGFSVITICMFIYKRLNR